jgi:hypothetical protein
MRRNKIAGNATLMTISVLAALVTFVGVAVEYTQSVAHYSYEDRTVAQAQSIGDGCLDLAFTSWRQICRNTPFTPSDTYHDVEMPPATSAFASIPLPTSAMFPDVPGFTATAGANDSAQSYTISNYKVQAVDPEITLAKADDLTSTNTDSPVSALASTATPVYATTIDENNDSPSGATPKNYYYLASVDVTLPTPHGKVTTRMRRIFEKRMSAVYDYAFFFQDDLECHPSAALTIRGPVHTNGKLYTGSSQLTFSNSGPAPSAPATTVRAGTFTGSGVTYYDDWVIGFKSGDSVHTGTASAPVFVAGCPPPVHAHNYMPFDWDPSQFNTTDSNQDNDGYHELIERPVNVATDPLNKSVVAPTYPSGSTQRWYTRCGTRLLVDGSTVLGNGTNPWKLYDSTGTLIGDQNALSSAFTSTSDTGKVYTILASCITTNKTMTDKREAATMTLVDFNYTPVKSAYGTSNWPGGTAPIMWWHIYITDTSATTSNHKAVRVKNVGTLVGGGIEICSDLPVYILGDFNTGYNGTNDGTTIVAPTTNPLSNSGSPLDPTKPYVTSPAYAFSNHAHIWADAVTILSNNWKDSNSGGALSTRIASNTTVHAQIITGNVPTSTANGYSGGAENLVRLLEDWSGKSLTFYGTQAQLWPSKYATGTWGKSGVYGEPANRYYCYYWNDFLWKHDFGFKFYTYNKHRWYPQGSLH